MSASNGNGKVVPAAYPPPVDSPKEFVKRGLDDPDDLIERVPVAEIATVADLADMGARLEDGAGART